MKLFFAAPLSGLPSDPTAAGFTLAFRKKGGSRSSRELAAMGWVSTKARSEKRRSPAGERGSLAVDLRSNVLADARPPQVALGNKWRLVLCLVQFFLQSNPFEKSLHTMKQLYPLPPLPIGALSVSVRGSWRIRPFLRLVA